MNSRPIPDRNSRSFRSVCRLPAATTFISVGLLAGSLLGFSGTASATERYVATERFTEYAQVIDVQPVYREVRTLQPREECWTEEQQVIVGYEDTVRRGYSGESVRRSEAGGSAIVGGLIGGVIGNQLGRGHSSSSRAGATVAGAIIGGALASEAQGSVSRHRRHEPPPRHVESRPIYEVRPIQRCRRVSESRAEQRLQHYNVTYRYKGREFVTQLPRDPGPRLELQVTVAPARR